MRFLGMMIAVCVLAMVASEVRATEFVVRSRAVVLDTCDGCEPVVAAVRVRDFGYGSNAAVFGVNQFGGYGVNNFGVRGFGYGGNDVAIRVNRFNGFGVRDFGFRRNDVNVRVNGFGGGFRNRVVVRVR